ncbi:MAG: translation initiation factor IF-2 [Chloroflexi bacterium]|nr:translation initiation factor IF-2 [Chloroflexota bacterium]
MSDNGRKVIELPAAVTVRQLADLLKASPIDIIKGLMSNGVMATINQQIDYDAAAIVISEMGYDAQPIAVIEEEKEEEKVSTAEWRKLIEHESEEDLILRPPVVTILGHVDHGKTSLLDAIRHTDVAAGEAGGITQHIGAYQIIRNQRSITFLDTPGHEAFTAMRARGAQATDIAVLVVAADDGVMPQTREAAAHAKAARVPIIVALNKIDKANASPDRVKQQLTDIQLTPDEWGGDTMVVPVSAKKKEGIDDLLEAILLTADDLKMKANPKTAAAGTVVEAQLEKAKGVMATLLVQNGTLHTGDVIIAGMVSGRIRRMFNDHGGVVEEAPPSTPVSVLGLSDVPVAGDIFRVVESDREARTLVAERKLATKEAEAKPAQAMTLEQVFEKFKAGEMKELALVIKADVQGSLEPLTNSLKKLSTDDIKVNILYGEIGNITENDVMLATASKAIIVGFAVQADAAATRLAEKNGVSIRLYDVIYRLTEDVEKALKGMLEPEYEEVLIGKAEVRLVIRIPKIGNIAGAYVRDGELKRNATVRVMRGGQKLFEGKLSSLKHVKDDVREVKQGFECGIGVDGFESFRTGDLIEFYVKQRKEVE